MKQLEHGAFGTRRKIGISLPVLSSSENVSKIPLDSELTFLHIISREG